MQAKKPYFEVSIISKKHNKKLKIFYIALIILFIFSIIFWIIFSIFNFFFIPKANSIQYYAIYITLEAQDNQTAETKATKLKARGGAGVVFKLEQKFCAILSIYPNQEYANKVKSQLINQGFSPNILNLNTAKINLSKLDKNQQEIAKNIHQKYLETINSLYDISTQLDTNILTESQAIMRINELALLWTQRAESVAEKIDISANSNESNSAHPLFPTYDLALSIAGQLNYLAHENTYSDSLKTFVSVIRQVNYTLIII